MQVKDADQIDITWILNNVDWSEAREIYQPHPPSSSKTRHKFIMPPLGTFRLDPWGEISVLVEIPVEDFTSSEGDWDYALRLPETLLYIQWQKEGLEPPPLSVVKTDKGNLVTQNRRRWLAARKAGIETLKCWYSPTHPEHCASPKWRVTEEGEDVYTLSKGLK